MGAALEPVFLEDRAVGRDDEDAGIAVENDPVVFFNQFARMVQGDDRGQRQAARHDRRVGRDAADVGDEAGELVRLEDQHVRRREVVRHHDHLAFLLLQGLEFLGTGKRGMFAGFTHEERFQDSFHHLHHIGPALAQILVLDRIELRHQRVHLLDQRPFSVAAPVFDDAQRLLRQHGVGQDHRMQIEKCADIAARRMPQARMQALEFGLHGRNSRLESRRFGADLRRLHQIVGDIERHGCHQMRAADRDAAGYAYAVQGKGHSIAAVVARAMRFIKPRRPERRSSRRLLAFTELVGDQLLERRHRAGLVFAGSLDLHSRANAGGEHHDPHDALAVDAPAISGQPDFAFVLGRELRQLGRCACMQTQLIDDLNFLLLRHDTRPLSC